MILGKKTQKTKHNILIVDDERSVLNALGRTFKNDYNVFMSTSPVEALQIFKHNIEDIALIISDQKMPEMSGVEFLKQINDLKPETIKIMLTAYTEISDIIDSINMCDLFRYMTKPWEDADLRLSVTKGLQNYDAIMDVKAKKIELEALNKQLEEANKGLSKKVDERTKALQGANKKLEKLAITDPLTGVNNRRYFEDRLKKEFGRVKRYSRNLSLAMFDVDHFKNYNDEHGHIAGDTALKILAEVFESNVRSSDFVSRYGGEEFVLTFPETGKVGAQEICERIRKGVEESVFPHHEEGKIVRLSVSAGIASFPEDAGDPRKLINKADKALYSAKDGGRNRVVLAS
jgi:diguanylate cyclase (GGDEF)-like protein